MLSYLLLVYSSMGTLFTHVPLFTEQYNLVPVKGR